MNIYYNPEKFKLTVVGEIDVGESYEFDTFVVWKKKDGGLICAEDSGCSCPTPFAKIGLSDCVPYSDSVLDEWVKRHYKRSSPIKVMELKKKCKKVLVKGEKDTHDKAP